MSTSSASVYWNVWRLVQQAGTNGESPVTSLRHRRLRARAYAILLDTDEEPYADIPEESRQLANSQAATAELLRLRAKGKHGTAARLSWRLDELAELHQRAINDRAPNDDIPRLVSLLLHLCGLGTGVGESGGRGADTIALQALPGLSSVPDTPGGSSGASAADTITAAFDGIPVGRRLRLQPPPKPAGAAGALDSAGPSSCSSHPGSTPCEAPASGSTDLPAAETLTHGRPAPTATTSPEGGWFPFRDSAGLPLLPAFDTPLEDLLLSHDAPQRWAQGAGMALPQLEARDCGGGGAGPGAALSLFVGAGPGPGVVSGVISTGGAGRLSPVMPLLAGPLHVSLVHTRFHHYNPLLMELSGTQSECFQLPVREVGALEAASAAVLGEDAVATGCGGEDAGSDGDPGEERMALPAPFALAALGVSAEHRLLTSAKSVTVVTDAGARPWPDPGTKSANYSVAVLGEKAGTGWQKGQRRQAAAGPGREVALVTVPSGAIAPRIRAMPLGAFGGGAAAVATFAATRSAAEDEVLLYDMAVLALQGVASALWMLRNGMIRSHSMRLSSQSRLLSQLCETGELRLRLANFVAAYGTYGTASQGGWGQHDEALAAFSDAVRELLTLYDRELQELAAWHRSVLASKQPKPRGSPTAGGFAAAPRSGSSKASSGGGGGSAPFSSLLSDSKDQQRFPSARAPGPAPAAAAAAGGGGGLLGLLLCLAPLRVHLQRLADVCMCVPDPAWIPPHSHSQVQGAAAARARGLRREEPGPRAPPPQLAPSLWQVYGFPQGPELLDHLYGALLQTDHAKTPLLRLLFAAACTPYVRRVRAWMYDPLEGGAGAAAAPLPPPSFLAPLQRQLTAAGLQMRLLSGLSGELGDIVGRFRRMAAAEAEEARLIAQQYHESLAPAVASTSTVVSTAPSATPSATLPGVDINSSNGGAGVCPGTAGGGAPIGGVPGLGTEDEFHYPLVFGLDSLQQLSEAAAAAASARDAELSSLLSLLDRRRQAASEAADRRVLAAAQAALAEEEAARAAKAAAAQERRLARSRLLAEQKAELDERAARVRAERERRIAEEQSLAAEAVLREHNEAAAALAAELARLRASYGGASYSEGGPAGGSAAALAAGLRFADGRAMEAAARLRRCEWREARMALAARRRLLWQGIEAEELAQLRQLVEAARSAQLAGPEALAAAAAAPAATASPRLPSAAVRQDGGAEAAGNAGGPHGPGTGGEGADHKGSGKGPAESAAPRGGDGGDCGDKVYGEEQGAAAAPRPPMLAASADAAATLLGMAGQSCLAQVPQQSTLGDTLGLPPLPALRVLAPRPGADGSTISPRALSSPRSPVVVASVGRPRRATYHDSGPPVAPLLSPRASAAAAAGGLLSGALRARASDGGTVAPRTPHLDAGPRLMGHRHVGSSARRAASVTGSGALSPSVSVPASWGAGPGGGFWPGADAFAGHADPGSRRTPTASTQGGSFFRPPSPGSWSERGCGVRQGPPRGYMPSTRASGRGPGGRGGAAGGLLLQLASRQSRRRWALPPDAASGAASGAFPSQPPPSWGLNGEDVEAVLRRLPGEAAASAGGSVAGVAVWGGAAEGAAAVHRGLQPWEPAHGGLGPETLSSGDAAAVAMWAAAAGAVEPQEAADADRGQPRRRALWNLPSAANPGAAVAVYDRTSTVGVLPAGSWHSGPYTQPSITHPLVASYAAANHTAAYGNNPVRTLLREYLADPRIGKASQGAQSPLRVGPSERQLNVNRSVAVVGGGSAAVAANCMGVTSSRGRRAPVSEDLAYAPVSVAVQTCLYGTVQAQYRLTTRAVWHVLVHGYRLVHFCAALRRFFFCEAGDVAGAVADSLTRRVEARPHVPPSTAELRAMLDEALQGCSLLSGSGAGAAAGRSGATSTGGGAEAAGPESSATAPAAAAAADGISATVGDEAAAVVQLLRVRSMPRRILGTGSFFASDVMYVTCQIPRPLDAVIPPDDVMRDYADIFSLLLRVRCTAAVLAACWSRLNAPTGPLVGQELGGGRQQPRPPGRRRGGSGGGEGGVHPLWLKRLAVARLWLQTASQVVALLRQHLQVELQGRCWDGLTSALNGPAAQDLMQMREAHYRYLACARQVCMLPPRDMLREPDAVAASPARMKATGLTTAAPPPHHQHQQMPLQQQPQLLPGAPLMDALQCAAALAIVLRRALTALESQSAAGYGSALTAPPRQPTVAPVLSAISRAAQTGPGDGRPSTAAGNVADGPGVAAADALTGDVPADDLDELWAHVVVCQDRLGRALGTLHAALRRGGGGSGGGETAGVLGEMLAVLTCEPCRAYTEAAASRLRG